MIARILIGIFLLSGLSVPDQSLRLVPTFHCLGIYWSPATGASTISCHVNYRREGDANWRVAQDLWFDDRQIDGRPQEYRGSIVNLAPGMTYEVQLWLQDDRRTEVLTAGTTWSENFPIQETIYVPSSHLSLTVTESGTPTGYALYTCSLDKKTIIDVQNREDVCVYLPEGMHHVILRGLILRGAARHAIRLSDHCHDIVIEECDISQWGNADSTGYGTNLQAAISAPFRANSIERIIVQRNDIHHPRGDANSWGEPRANPDGDPFHPQGPYGLVFYDTNGNHVIRFNRFYTDEEHYFCDILGAGSNISHQGFPNKDTDIYGNSFANCWDDAIEAEGANENVRIWDNEINHVYHPIGAVVTSVGPLYIWRNVVGQSRKFGHLRDSDDYGRGEFIKCGGVYADGVWYGDGRIYAYHNTIVQPLGTGRLPLGCEGAFIAEGKSLYNAVSRNNIFTNSKLDSYTFRDNPQDDAHCGRNDFDYDLYTGRIKETCPNVMYEKNGIALTSNDQIVFNPADPAGPYALMPGSPGHDAGVLLPNFNDVFTGAAPDMGAVESEIDTAVEGCDGHASLPARLYQNSPNPFNTQTKILFLLNAEADVCLTLYDICGRRIRELTKGRLGSGHHVVVWDGENQQGEPAPSGLYVCQLALDGYGESRKLVLIR
ncbi:right-handed parallel beta-helix repeat-containing protein [candidate division KSB1 bacterium]|nr:right-handed parallel beta-helix repeat-containing protein [candidate division KSB1 bacterium]